MMFLIPVVMVDLRRRLMHVLESLRHIYTHKGVSASIIHIGCEDDGGGDL